MITKQIIYKINKKMKSKKYNRKFNKFKQRNKVKIASK